MIAGTLGRYFARRFFTMIAAVFSGVFALITRSTWLKCCADRATRLAL